jgi:hypothetical protein
MNFAICPTCRRQHHWPSSYPQGLCECGRVIEPQTFPERYDIVLSHTGLVDAILDNNDNIFHLYPNRDDQ